MIFSHKDIKDNSKDITPAMLKKVTSDQGHHPITSTTVSETKEKEKSDTNSAPTIVPTATNPPQKEENFIEKHSRWLRGVQLLD